MKYSVQMNFNATIVVDVEVENGPDAEGKALELAREMAENADIKEFSICGEREAQILNHG